MKIPAVRLSFRADWLKYQYTAKRRRNTIDRRKSALLNARGYARQVGDDDPVKVSDEANY